MAILHIHGVTDIGLNKEANVNHLFIHTESGNTTEIIMFSESGGKIPTVEVDCTGVPITVENIDITK